MFLRRLFFILCFLIVQLHATACMSGKIPVITSIYPIADMVQQVGGDYVDVTFVLPPGASPHTFEPKPSLVRTFSSARIFFMIGAGLEFWADKFVKLAGSELMTVILSQGVDLIETTEHDHENHHHEKETMVSENKPMVANPHIWLDPVIAKSMVNKITAALCEVDHKNVLYYKQRSLDYLQALDQLHRMIQGTVSNFKMKKYIAFHASWDYFARRYGLESVDVIEAAPGRNPTPIKIKNIVAMIDKYHIRAVFAEPQLNYRAAEVIAREADVKVLLLDPMGNPKQKYGNTYMDLMKHNLNILKEAMK
ncbi:MAG: zinc ABC transporter substrate-binding protein [Deltaproteobacteria bacterium]|nr:zinc ABC transporter substrate-binding protein [Deltaproteobacteria bacterium]